jgi:hypothetical protein
MAYPTRPTGSDIIPEYNFAANAPSGQLLTMTQTEYEAGYNDSVNPIDGTALGKFPLAGDFNRMFRQSHMNARYATEKASCLDNRISLSYYGTDATAIESFKTSVGSDNVAMVITETITVGANTTIPSNITVIVEADGEFSVTTGFTLTLNGQLISNSTNCISGDGTVKFISQSYVIPEWYGAVSGSDSTTAFTRMVASLNASTNSPSIESYSGSYTISSSIGKLPDDCVWNGHNTVINASVAGTNIFETSDNNIINNIRFEGVGLTAIKVSGSGITINNCSFIGDLAGKSFSHCIHLYTASRIVVDKCYFYGQGYQVVQQTGYVSDTVTVSNCVSDASLNDFVLPNCASTAPSKDWLVTGNHYKGAAGFPTSAVECRFAGGTSVENVIISNNIVEQTCGDSAIHLEDTLGEYVISGNIFKNCVSGGSSNAPFIYPLNSAKTFICTGNIFEYTNAGLTGGYCINFSSGNYTNAFLISNNRFVNTSGGTNLSGIDVSFHSGLGVITGNTFEGLNVGINAINSSYNKNCTNNIFTGNQISINMDPNGATGGNNRDWDISSNQFVNAVSGAHIVARRNTSGTQPHIRISIKNNLFDIGGVYGYDTQDCVMVNNIAQSGVASFSIGLSQYATSTNYLSFGNTFSGSNIVEPIKPITSISSTPSYIGQIALVSGIMYISVNTSSSADWVEIGQIKSAAISDSVGGDESSKINAILAALRTHQIISTT